MLNEACKVATRQLDYCQICGLTIELIISWIEGHYERVSVCITAMVFTEELHRNCTTSAKDYVTVATS